MNAIRNCSIGNDVQFRCAISIVNHQELITACKWYYTKQSQRSLQDQTMTCELTNHKPIQLVITTLL